MALKLSRLQLRILELALQNAQMGSPTSLRQVVGLVLGLVDLPDPLVEERGQVLRKSLPGYNPAMASSSRAVRRLERRGLVYRHAMERGCSLFALTLEGANVAEGLTVSLSGSMEAKGKKAKRPPRILTRELPTFLQQKRLSHDQIQAAKDAEWRPLP